MSVRQGSSDALAEAVRVLKPGGAGAGQEGDAEVSVEQQLQGAPIKRKMRLQESIAFITGIVALAVAIGAAAADGTAKGTLTYQAKSGAITITPKFAYLVKGPDAVDDKLIIRHLILSATDLGAKIAACATMSCTNADLMNGMTVDFDAGPRLNYWVVLNDQRVQYSGTAKPAVLTLTADTATRLAGKLTLDGTAGGPKVEIEFDAPLLKELKIAR